MLKAMGNPAGEHALACEWVGSRLANEMGLPTFEIEILHVPLDLADFLVQRRIFLEDHFSFLLFPQSDLPL